jgi:hypothetical protein
VSEIDVVEGQLAHSEHVDEETAAAPSRARSGSRGGAPARYGTGPGT